MINKGIYKWNVTLCRFREGHLPITSPESTSLPQNENSGSHSRETQNLPRCTEFSLTLQQELSSGCFRKQKDLLTWDTRRLPRAETWYEELQLCLCLPKDFPGFLPEWTLFYRSLVLLDHRRKISRALLTPAAQRSLKRTMAIAAITVLRVWGRCQNHCIIQSWVLHCITLELMFHEM